MQVNRALNSVYRFYERNPKAMRAFVEKTEGLIENYSSKIIAESTVLSSKMEPMIENPTLAKFFEKIGKLALRPVFNEVSSEYMSKVKNIETLKTDYVGQIKMITSLKSGIRKALRKDPEANAMTKELIKDMKKPENKGVFESLSQFLKSFSTSNSESMANFGLDMAKLAPKEIRSDYLTLMMQNDKVMETPSVDLYSNILTSLVKK